MKKTFLHKIPVLALILAGAFLFGSANNISAQNSKDPLYAEADGPFVSYTTAIQRLDGELASIKLQMSQLNPTSGQYKNLELKYAYYEHIDYLIAEAKTPSSKMIGAMIVIGLEIYDKYNATYQQKLANRQDVIALLKS